MSDALPQKLGAAVDAFFNEHFDQHLRFDLPHKLGVALAKVVAEDKASTDQSLTLERNRLLSCLRDLVSEYIPKGESSSNARGPWAEVKQKWEDAYRVVYDPSPEKANEQDVLTLLKQATQAEGMVVALRFPKGGTLVATHGDFKGLPDLIREHLKK